MSASPGRKPSNALETETSPPRTARLLAVELERVVAAVAGAQLHRTEMNAGTRITRGLIRPPRPVNSASDRAGSSSPPSSSRWCSGVGVKSVSGLGRLRRRLGFGLGPRLGLGLARGLLGARLGRGRGRGGGLVPLVVVPAAGGRQR